MRILFSWATQENMKLSAGKSLLKTREIKNNMGKVKSYAALHSDTPLESYDIERRKLNSEDVNIEILYCGVCHSDIHMARNEWNNSSIYPMVPGHEIIGIVKGVGKEVTKFKIGDAVGVGVYVDACEKCQNCNSGKDHYCEEGIVLTYNSYEYGTKNITYGGYSKSIVVKENYVIKVPEGMNMEKTAPLLCAGITTYSPLRHFKINSSHKVGIAGLGGLGHMGLKFASSFGAEVVVFSTSDSKKDEAFEMGANHFVNVNNNADVKKHLNSCDYILDTVSANRNMAQVFSFLKTDGLIMLVGLPMEPLAISSFSLIDKRKGIVGSSIGSIGETQEMIDYCNEKNIYPEVEMIPISKINEAFDRTINKDVRYRFVIDMSSL